MLIIFSGGSGVGKNTVIEHLIAGGGYAIMPTYTTRDRRVNEYDGNPYYFISDREFAQKLAEGEFYESQKVHNHYYGTSKKLLDESLASGKILLKDIDVLGTLNLQKAIGDQIKILSIFLRVDSVDVLAERLKHRGEQEIELRLRRFQMEQEYAVNYDYIITNNNLEETLYFVSNIVTYEKSNLHPCCTINPAQICEQKVREIADDMNRGQTFPPVQIAVKDKKIYIIKGHHRYLASVLAGKRIAKEFICPDSVTETKQDLWQDMIQRFLKK